MNNFPVLHEHEIKGLALVEQLKALLQRPPATTEDWRECAEPIRSLQELLVDRIWAPPDATDPLATSLIDIGSQRVAMKDPNRILANKEIYSSDPIRISQLTGSAPADITMGDIEIHGLNVQMINLHIHDVSSFGWWTPSSGVMRGCLIQNVGWDASDRGHGHCLYEQNKLPNRKLVEACIFIKGFGDPATVYGSNAAFLEGMRFNQIMAQGGRMLIGGSPVKDVQVENSLFYSNLQLGYQIDPNVDITVRNSTILGLVQANKTWDSLSFTDTIVAGDVIYVHDPNHLNIQWDNNIYIGTRFTGDNIPVGVKAGFDKWKAETGFDTHSRWFATPTEAFAAGVIESPLVRYVPVNEDGHIADIGIWNFAGYDQVTVELPETLEHGYYELRQVRDYKLDRRRFLHCGDVLVVDMHGNVKPPTGIIEPLFHPDAIPANSFPTFGIFQLWRDE